MFFCENRLLCFLFIILVFQETWAKTEKNGNGENVNSAVSKQEMKRIDAKEGKPIKSGLRLSAWGIISGIVSVVLCGIFIYYFLLFYPILCRKERNYDVVEHSRDTTPTPNAEKYVEIEALA